jgi:hypothetical protein
MAGTFRNSSVASITAGTALAINAPSGLANADFILSLITGNFATVTYTPPSGFSLLDSVMRSVATPEGQGSGVYSKVASGEGASWTWTASASDSHGGGVAAWSGIASIAASNNQQDSASNASPVTVTFPSVTTTAPNQTVVLLCALDMTAAGTTVWSALPGGYTERAVQGFSLPPYGAVWVAEGVKASAGATGAQTAVVTLGGGGTSGWISWAIALQDIAGNALQESEWHPMELQTNPMTVSLW